MAENEAVEAKSTEEEKITGTPHRTDGEGQPDIAETNSTDAPERDDASVADQPDKKGDKRRKRRISSTERQLVAWFAACGRCSFFLAGYRLTCSQSAWETAVAQRKKKWLVLPWSHAAANLVYKTYGSRIDVDCYHYAGQCRECHRRFIFQADDEESEAATFRIELKP